MANWTNAANTNPDPPTPADRVVPIHGWRTKKGQKGDKRGGALGSISSFPGFSSRTVLGWCFYKITLVWYIGAVPKKSSRIELTKEAFTEMYLICNHRGRDIQYNVACRLASTEFNSGHPAMTGYCSMMR